MQSLPPLAINHVALYVRDLDTAREFYQRSFAAASDDGYHNPATGLRSRFLSFGDGARLEYETGVLDPERNHVELIA